jgi:hypothetical protein
LDCRKQLTDQSVLLSRCPVYSDPVAAPCLVDLHAFFFRHQNFWCQNFC